MLASAVFSDYLLVLVLGWICGWLQINPLLFEHQILVRVSVDGYKAPRGCCLVAEGDMLVNVHLFQGY